MKFKLCLIFSLATLGVAAGSYWRPANAAISAIDFCASTQLKAIVDAIICKRDNCPGDASLYDFACTQVDPADAARLGGNSIRVDTSEDTRAAALIRVNDSYPSLEALVSTRIDPPPKLTELPPCECLALIEARTKCGIEQCPPDKPAEPPPVQPPPEAPAPPKAQVPEEPAPAGNGQIALSGGGLCSLSFADSSRQAPIWAWLGLLNGSLLLISRRFLLSR